MMDRNKDQNLTEAIRERPGALPNQAIDTAAYAA
jgi:hypothetical protein